MTQTQNIDQSTYLQVYKRHPITLVKGQGARVTDDQGKTYIDALAGVAVNSVGHCHPKVVKAIQDQAEKLIHISNFYVSEPQAALSKTLTELSGLDRVFLGNSGAEAVETAFKLARIHGHGHAQGGRIISMEGCFHGRSLGTIAAGKKAYQEGFDPIPPGFAQVPFNDLHAVEKAINKETCAVIVEPVQGEGGIRPAQKGFLQGLRKLCDEKGLLLILDEIQCGIGRTGSFFAYEQYGVEPDILCLAKAMGGGAPIGATICRQKVADSITYGKHGSTFGGNPLASAAANAAIEAVNEEELAQRAAKLGKMVQDKVRDATREIPAIKEVRGMGLMIGVDVGSNEIAKASLDHMIQNGILGNVTADSVIRLVPPLVIREEDLMRVVEVMLEGIEKAEK